MPGPTWQPQPRGKLSSVVPSTVAHGKEAEGRGGDSRRSKGGGGVDTARRPVRGNPWRRPA
ncbi:hypothetical protein E2562_001166 [Oryza meyeriana var. granulata]|uniref:Uncharacterized protein n=1 Tax=Oryza meyeriana var. granulata TaxID=110450 RepID=A0A6G1DBW3_9ORYZ|nr:hypothetical protein E2562_001166 [Oryza meyeriana var. granulata]